jgi:molybdate transport system substrate-binding protein
MFGENVAQATQYVASGAAAIGFVSHSVVRLPAMAVTLISAAIPATLHSPLDQRLAVSAKASPAAVAFAAFLMSADAQQLFSAFDFDSPPG